ncbi:RHS repeat-associated core domain-containing protein [Trinickia sp. NRRL B-1857]|uniref:RHS repeat-associated core domain-containing protein n=1 Tax=Trinickia sp. NRRL B-1857 TaxID=3162879 RepID=UPI003D29B923
MTTLHTSGPAQAAAVHSNAFNFLSFVQTGVDPRTGLYTVSLSLPPVAANGLTGPTLSASLAFNPMQTDDRGFGIGWGLRLSSYDAVAQVLRLSSGEVYRAYDTGSTLVVEDQKLRTFSVEKVGSDFVIAYKSGVTEVLSTRSGGAGLYLPETIRSHEGRTLTLRYATFGNHRMLSEVIDETRTLISITRASGLISIVVWPGSPQAATLSMWLVNAQVTELRLPVDNRAAWRFVYETLGEYTLISRVDTPLGGYELVRHQARGHAFPAGAPQGHLPYVIEHVRGPRAGQPVMRSVYRYSNRNFLGYGANGLVWVNGQDNLCKVLEDYRYDSVETWMEGEGSSERVLRTITRTYNRFHLLLSEETRERAHVRRQETQYHVLDGRPYADQPRQCQLPQRVSTSWAVHDDFPRRREEVVTTSFDEYGNLLCQVDAVDVTEQYAYYDLAGEDGCPPHPHGFVRFMKEKRVIPAQTEQTTGQAPSTVTRYRYAAIPSLLPYSPPAIVQTLERLYEANGDDERLVREVETSYYDTPSDPSLHAREKTRTVTVQGFKTRTHFTYAMHAGALEVVQTVTGFDDTQRTTRMLRSLVDGQDLEVETEGGAHVRYRYDALGRVSSETTAPDTPFEATRRYHYALASAADDDAFAATTDANGLTTRTWYDGLQRKIRVEMQADAPAGEPYRLSYAARYDAAGQLVEETNHDWLENAALALVSRHEYDDWGERCMTIRGDGVVEHRVFDPIARTETCWLDDRLGHVSGHIVTQRNGFDKPTSVERIDTQGAIYSKSVSAYDGLGRLVRESDAAGYTTEFDYDVFGRTTHRRLPDGTALEYDYARHSDADLPTEIRLHPASGAPMVIGQQRFDGLDRCVSRTVGGRRRTFIYDGAFDAPSIEQTPRGESIHFGYEPRLTDKPVRRSTRELEDRYTYDPRHAQLVAMSSQGQGEHRFTYSPLGQLLREAWLDAGRPYEASYIHSMQGRPLRYIDCFGREQRTEYDAAGRAASVAYETLASRIDYDGYGRIHHIVTQDMQSDRALTVTCRYDDFGREIERSFSIDRTIHTVITQTYTNTDKLARRAVRARDVTLRTESYNYDSRGRLVDYRCEGAQPPRDSFGNAIVAQRYAYDGCDNILTITTEFLDGQDVARYRYENPDDPTQLTGIAHTHPHYPSTETLAYDQDGNLERTSSRAYRYDTLGRLTEVERTQEGVPGRYRYDARDRLTIAESDDGARTHSAYRETQLIGELLSGGPQGELQRRYLREGELLLAQRDGASSSQVVLCGGDMAQTVRLALSSASGTAFDIAYTPYGARPLEAGLPGLLGIQGQRYDVLAGGYLLGNGARLYDPSLMRFLSPDSMSPFHGGGINGYAYCLGDPINLVDPTGALSWQSILGIVIGAVAVAVAVASLGTGIAISAGLAQASAGLAAFATVPSATLSGVLAVGAVAADIVSGATAIASSALSERDPQAAGILGWVSTGFGVAATAQGFSGAVSGVANTSRGTASAASARFAVARSTLAVAASMQGVSTQIAAALGKEPPAWASYALSGLSLALAGAGWGSALGETAFAARNGRSFDLQAVELAQLGARATPPARAQSGATSSTQGTSVARANRSVRRVGAPNGDEEGNTRL